jgi:hypothetical protein
MKGSTLEVIRKKGPTWEFRWDGRRKAFVHRGHKYLYVISANLDDIVQGFWVGLIQGNAVLNVTKEVGAVFAKFPQGGRWYF